MLLCKFSPITSGTWVLIIVQSGTFLSAVVLAPRTSDVISFSTLFWEQTAHFSRTLETNVNLFSCLEIYYLKLKNPLARQYFNRQLSWQIFERSFHFSNAAWCWFEHAKLPCWFENSSSWLGDSTRRWFSHTILQWRFANTTVWRWRLTDSARWWQSLEL